MPARPHLLGRAARFFCTTVHPTALPRRRARTPLSALAPKTTFASHGLHPSITSALSSANIHTPTSIQLLSLPPLLSRKHVLLAAETGAGKTLAYLAPLLSHLKRAEQAPQTTAGSIQVAPPCMRPTVLVLVPTRELAVQVLRVAKTLAHVAKFRARAAMGGSQRVALKRALREAPVDVLVGTPGAVNNLIDQKLIYLSKVQAVVVDEADALLAEKGGFADQTLPIVDSLGKKEDVQFVYAGATVPGSVREEIEKRHDGLEVVKGKRFHKALGPADLKTTFIRVDGGEEAKLAKAVEIAGRVLRQKGGADRLLVFCDERERRERLVDLLREHVGENVVHLCGRNDYQDRERDWDSFLGTKTNGEQTRVAVCAKSFGRGLDHHGIGTVLLVDVPWTGSEYLHRVGRIRGSGKAFVLVGNREQAVAEALFLGHVKGESLDSIQPRSAWKGYTTAGKDRITTEPMVNFARRKGQARWVDERPHAIGSARDAESGPNFRRNNGNEAAHSARRGFLRRDRRVNGATSSETWSRQEPAKSRVRGGHKRGGRFEAEKRRRVIIADNW
ncbi:unnamed protein product [Chondrus crispus]|uniref:P-loop containing nucleoside triphosphate hydrolase protein n=1 Tax=Chondrus crispus TaxID=2769 RepID=R7Q761_CHOCR|nr:unnamed protein product [Chondrus crispus]CDF34367.1 unnamed protein product [Chondrus crispus]|eukprot:XP_005714186.1 unnamed protein product [Chondrus crispus]